MGPSFVYTDFFLLCLLLTLSLHPEKELCRAHMQRTYIIFPLAPPRAYLCWVDTVSKLPRLVSLVKNVVRIY